MAPIPSTCVCTFWSLLLAGSTLPASLPSPGPSPVTTHICKCACVSLPGFPAAVLSVLVCLLGACFSFCPPTPGPTHSRFTTQAEGTKHWGNQGRSRQSQEAYFLKLPFLFTKIIYARCTKSKQHKKGRKEKIQIPWNPRQDNNLSSFGEHRLRSWVIYI